MCRRRPRRLSKKIAIGALPNTRDLPCVAIERATIIIKRATPVCDSTAVGCILDSSATACFVLWPRTWERHGVFGDAVYGLLPAVVRTTCTSLNSVSAQRSMRRTVSDSQLLLSCEAPDLLLAVSQDGLHGVHVTQVPASGGHSTVESPHQPMATSSTSITITSGSEDATGRRCSFQNGAQWQRGRSPSTPRCSLGRSSPRCTVHQQVRAEHVR